MAAAPQTRFDGLDGFRGIAAAAIVLLHVWMFGGAHQPQQSQLVDTVIGALALSLMMFFVLSGYLVSRPWVRAAIAGAPAPPLRGYAIKRAARILPAYWLAVLGSFALMQAIGHPKAVPAEQLPLFLTFVMNQVPSTNGMLNPPMWSLGVEVMFYLALPLLGAAMIALAGRHGRAGLIGLCAALTFAGLAWTAWLQEIGVPPTLLMTLPTYLPIFACGIAAAVLIEGRRLGRPLRTVLLVAGGALAIWNGWWHSDGTGWTGQVLRDLPAGVGFGMMIAASVYGPARLTGSAVPRLLGEWSYGIYLWHMPALYLARHLGWWRESPWESYAIVMGAATAAGALSYYALERPVLRWAAGRARRAGARPLAQPASGSASGSASARSMPARTASEEGRRPARSPVLSGHADR